MSLRATSIRINSRMDYRVRNGASGASRLRDLLDVDGTTADEPSENQRFLVYDSITNNFRFTNQLDANPEDNTLAQDYLDF